MSVQIADTSMDSRSGGVWIRAVGAMALLRIGHAKPHRQRAVCDLAQNDRFRREGIREFAQVRGKSHDRDFHPRPARAQHPGQCGRQSHCRRAVRGAINATDHSGATTAVAHVAIGHPAIRRHRGRLCSRYLRTTRSVHRRPDQEGNHKERREIAEKFLHIDN